MVPYSNIAMISDTSNVDQNDIGNYSSLRIGETRSASCKGLQACTLALIGNGLSPSLSSFQVCVAKDVTSRWVQRRKKCWKSLHVWQCKSPSCLICLRVHLEYWESCFQEHPLEVTSDSERSWWHSGVIQDWRPQTCTPSTIGVHLADCSNH